jgi:hypothetical protein
MEDEPKKQPSDASAAKTTEQMIEEAEKAGVTVTVTTEPPATGEITLLPGVRMERGRDLLEDDDGSGVAGDGE